MKDDFSSPPRRLFVYEATHSSTDDPERGCVSFEERQRSQIVCASQPARGAPSRRGWLSHSPPLLLLRAQPCEAIKLSFLVSCCPNLHGADRQAARPSLLRLAGLPPARQPWWGSCGGSAASEPNKRTSALWPPPLPGGRRSVPGRGSSRGWCADSYPERLWRKGELGA